MTTPSGRSSLLEGIPEEAARKPKAASAGTNTKPLLIGALLVVCVAFAAWRLIPVFFGGPPEVKPEQTKATRGARMPGAEPPQTPAP